MHGPLNLINLLDYWRDIHGARNGPREVTYRAISPVYAGETYHIRTGEVRCTGSVRTVEIIAEKGGVTCMEAIISSDK